MKTVRQRNILKSLYEAYDMLVNEQQEVRNRIEDRHHWITVTNHIEALANVLQAIENQDYPYREIA